MERKCSTRATRDRLRDSKWLALVTPKRPLQVGIKPDPTNF